MHPHTDAITIELALPREQYERAESEARKQHRSIEEMIPELIEAGLRSHLSARELMEQLSEEYRSRLIATSEPELTPEQLLEKLRQDREDIVNARYP